MINACKDMRECVTRCFGRRLNELRKAFIDQGMRYEDKEATLKVEGKISYLTADGCTIEMSNRVRIDINGEEKGKNEVHKEVIIKSGLMRLRLENPTFNLNEEDTGRHIRNGFVNFVQGLDGLVARMVIVNLRRQGVRYITSIHDCFKVCIHDIAKLKVAIQETYTALFGGREISYTNDLPFGNDFLELYFDGANDSLLEGERRTELSQFYKDGVKRRNCYMINGVTIDYLIQELGTSYFCS
jgi:hypothetical protein